MNKKTDTQQTVLSTEMSNQNDVREQMDEYTKIKKAELEV